MKNCVKILVLFSLFLSASGVCAADKKSCEDDCVEIGAWSFSVGLGLGLRTNPVESKENTPLIVLPEVSYYGKRFFLKNLELGVLLWENSSHQLNFVLTPSADQRHFNRWDLNNFTDGSSSSNTFTSFPVSSGGSQSNGDGSPITGAPNNPDASKEVEGGGVMDGGIDKSVTESSGASSGGGSSGAALVPSVKEGNHNLVGDLNEPVVGNDRPNSITDSSVDEASGKQNDSDQITNNDSNPKSIEVSLEKRKMAGLAGFEYMYSAKRLNLHFQALQDVSNVHSGYELRFAAIIPFAIESNQWALTMGVNYQSQQVINYYYGIDISETPSPSLVYSTDSAGFSEMVRLDWQKPLSRHWSLRPMAQKTQLSNSVSDSPIISKPYVVTVFVGGVYHF